jgi:hypothetical protein
VNRIKEFLGVKGIQLKWLDEQLVKRYNIVNYYIQNRQRQD